MTTIDDLVSRFLAWELPQDFAPDSGVSFAPLGHHSAWPTGTNLLTAAQAMAMLEHVLGDSLERPTPAPGQCPQCGEYSMSARAAQGLFGTAHEVGNAKGCGCPPNGRCHQCMPMGPFNHSANYSDGT